MKNLSNKFWSLAMTPILIVVVLIIRHYVKK